MEMLLPVLASAFGKQRHKTEETQTWRIKSLYCLPSQAETYKEAESEQDL